MRQTNEKPCIQKRIMTRLSKRLPEFWFLVSLLSLITILLILENSEYSYSGYLENLDYEPQIKDLVTLIVTTDGFIIAFTGVIASMILKHVLEKGEKVIDTSVAMGNQTIHVSTRTRYKEMRSQIIKFVLFILVPLVISIGFSLGVIITQFFPFSIVSIICLFVGLIELVTMLYYSLKI